MNGRALLGTLSLVLLALLVWELRWVLLVLFGAVVLAVALDVPVSLLRRRLPLNRPSAVALVIVALVLVGWKVSVLLLPEVLQQANQFTQLLPVLLQRLGDLAGGSMAFRSFEERLLELATWDKLQPLGTQLLGVAGGAASSTIPILLMELLAILLALDPRPHQRLMLEAREALGGWLAGMTISAVTVFLLTWAGLALLKVPLALLSGLVCGLLTFVPTIGPTVATALPLAVALLISPAKVAQVLVLRLMLQNAEAFVLTPLLLSRTVNLLPTVALMAQLSLGALLGLPGVLLALPLVVVLQVVFQRVLVEQVMDRWT
ncbi:AI-2E family transporter [Synechococcus sp. EJ6-Ellesmere]|uniref:AI-2E family transporter n=1 Tax=Synechococcus sp. EJ6-Ellesmere TaxID=2823734 RepID=UPI0020CB8775|nr:AI-2E family transporter [Synechococcus sp. EJ6-Ellesmere]MCP9825432.1 AI-2E family transporter [Synechococcus sp. EJ6-Ellesmere]